MTQHLYGSHGTLVCDATDNPGCGVRRMSFHAGVDALGAECNEYVSANMETPRLQRLYKKFAGAPT